MPDALASTARISIAQEGGAWIARFEWSHEAKELVKRAGFRFDGTKKRWWTNDAAVAARLSPEGMAAWQAELVRQAEADKAKIEASRATDAAIDIPVPAGLSYLPYQRGGIAYALDRPAVLIGDEMGLGKTIQAIGIINADPAIKNVLVICPASLKLNWQRELQKWLTRPLRIGSDVVILNYEMVMKGRAQLDRREWDLLISDECHYLKNPKADRTRGVLGGREIPEKVKRGKVIKAAKSAIAAIKARRRVFLTGTPIVNRPIELWPLAEALDPQGIGRNFMSFARRYCAAHQNGWGWDFSGASNLDELQAKLRASVMVRRLKADVLTELPPKRRQVILIEPEGELAGYIAREREIEARHEDRLLSARAAVELAKAESDAAYQTAVTSLRDEASVAFEEMSAARRDLAIAKAPQVIEHIKEALESTDKIVVMAHHHDVVDSIANALGDIAVRLDGRMGLTDRQGSVDRFQQDPTCKVFVGSIRAAGVGITLTASSTVIFAELDWTPGNVSQAEDRCHRIGQRDSVLVQHLVVDGSIDARMAHILIEKQEVIDAALDKGAAMPEAADLPAVEFVTEIKRGERATPEQPATHDARREQIRAEGAKLSPEQVEAVHRGLRLLAGLDADRAMIQNDIGFNRMDGKIGHSLAANAELTRPQAALGRRLLLKYCRQLGPELAAAIKGNE